MVVEDETLSAKPTIKERLDKERDRIEAALAGLASIVVSPAITRHHSSTTQKDAVDSTSLNVSPIHSAAVYEHSSPSPQADVSLQSPSAISNRINSGGAPTPPHQDEETPDKSRNRRDRKAPQTSHGRHRLDDDADASRGAAPSPRSRLQQASEKFDALFPLRAVQQPPLTRHVKAETPSASIHTPYQALSRSDLDLHVPGHETNWSRRETEQQWTDLRRSSSHLQHQQQEQNQRQPQKHYQSREHSTVEDPMSPHLLHSAKVTSRPAPSPTPSSSRSRVLEYDCDGNTTLHHMALNGLSHEIEQVLRDGVDVNSKNNSGIPPLQCAVHSGDLSTVKLIILANANVDAVADNGNTALHWAAWNGSVEIIKLLLASGADVNIGNNQGSTPLMCAVTKAPMSAIEYIMSGKNVDVNTANVNNMTALHLACQKGREDVAQYLLEHGAYVNAVNRCAESPLTLACAGGFWGCVEILLRAGADLDIISLTGISPRELLTAHDMTRLIPPPEPQEDVVVENTKRGAYASVSTNDNSTEGVEGVGATEGGSSDGGDTGVSPTSRLFAEGDKWLKGLRPFSSPVVDEDTGTVTFQPDLKTIEDDCFVYAGTQCYWCGVAPLKGAYYTSALASTIPIAASKGDLTSQVVEICESCESRGKGAPDPSQPLLKISKPSQRFALPMLASAAQLETPALCFCQFDDMSSIGPEDAS